MPAVILQFRKQKKKGKYLPKDWSSVIEVNAKLWPNNFSLTMERKNLPCLSVTFPIFQHFWVGGRGGGEHGRWVFVNTFSCPSWKLDQRKLWLFLTDHTYMSPSSKRWHDRSLYLPVSNSESLAYNRGVKNVAAGFTGKWWRKHYFWLYGWPYSTSKSPQNCTSNFPVVTVVRDFDKNAVVRCAQSWVLIFIRQKGTFSSKYDTSLRGEGS